MFDDPRYFEIPKPAFANLFLCNAAADCGHSRRHLKRIAAGKGDVIRPGRAADAPRAFRRRCLFATSARAQQTEHSAGIICTTAQNENLSPVLDEGVAGSNPATPTSSTPKALIIRIYLQTLVN
jgi:hypothetical protein